MEVIDHSACRVVALVGELDVCVWFEIFDAEADVPVDAIGPGRYPVDPDVGCVLIRVKHPFISKQFLGHVSLFIFIMILA